jgi:hypothetical protein
MPDPVDEELEALADYIGTTSVELDAYLPNLLDTCKELIDDYLKSTGKARCPEYTYTLAVKQLGNALWDKRNNASGIVFSAGGDTTARLARDSMSVVTPLISRYRGLRKPG